MLTARAKTWIRSAGQSLALMIAMVKPFNPLELVARIRANLRRFQKQHSNNIYFKQIILDLEAKRLYKNEQEVDLTPTEFAILKL